MRCFGFANNTAHQGTQRILRATTETYNNRHATSPTSQHLQLLARSPHRLYRSSPTSFPLLSCPLLRFLVLTILFSSVKAIAIWPPKISSLRDATAFDVTASVFGRSSHLSSENEIREAAKPDDDYSRPKRLIDEDCQRLIGDIITQAGCYAAWDGSGDAQLSAVGS